MTNAMEHEVAITLTDAEMRLLFLQFCRDLHASMEFYKTIAPGYEGCWQ